MKLLFGDIAVDVDTKILHDKMSFLTDETEYLKQKNTEKKTTKGFHDLPINNQLQILSYLDVVSISRAAQVNSLWNQLTADSLLWETKLQKDSEDWLVVDHLSYPENYRRTCPDLSAKEIYIKCCPAIKSYNKYMFNRNSNVFTSIVPIVQQYLGFLHTPRIVMFGSGLDTMGLVGRIMQDPRSPFVVKGMFPGEYDGVGSGVTLSYKDGSVDLITLYALSKAERENEDNSESRLITTGESGGSKKILSNSVRSLCASIKSFIYVVDSTSKEKGELGTLGFFNFSVRSLCASIKSFIYVVDSTSKEKVRRRIDEFRAMMDDCLLQTYARILILCIVPNATVDSVPSLEVADILGLVELSRPWQVRQCHVNSLYGFLPGLQWVVGWTC